MRDADKPTFARVLGGTLEVYQRNLTEAAASIWWQALKHYDLEAVRTAFQHHLTDPDQGRFPPTPAAIIAHIPQVAAVMSADEAWGLCVASFDERETVVVTDLMLDALRASNAGETWTYDKVGARMAFKSAYDRLASQARVTGRAPTWQVSLGWDEGSRRLAIEAAIVAGHLTHEQAQGYLPAPEATTAGQALAGLLTGKVVPIPQDDATKARLEALRASLARKHQGASEAQARREDIEARRREALDYLRYRQEGVIDGECRVVTESLTREQHVCAP